MAAFTFPSVNLEKHSRRFVKIEATTEGGENTLVEATEGKSIVVLSYAITVTKAGLYKFKDEVATLGALQLVENGGASYAGGNDGPAFVCTVSKPLKFETVASAKGYGHLCYCLV